MQAIKNKEQTSSWKPQAIYRRCIVHKGIVVGEAKNRMNE